MRDMKLNIGVSALVVFSAATAGMMVSRAVAQDKMAPTKMMQSALKASDKAFLTTVGHGNAAEIATAKLALTKTSDESIKSAAQMMIDDHTKVQSETMDLGKNLGVMVPDQPDAKHNCDVQVAQQNVRSFVR